MANLYELETNYKNLLQVLEYSDDETLNEIVEKSLNELQDELNKKAENIIKYSRNLRAEAGALKCEAKRLSDKQKSLEKRADSLERYLFNAMKYAQRDTIKAGVFDVSIRKNPESLKITDESLIPAEYLKIKYEVDKVNLKTALKNGTEINGVELERKEVLKIK